jgi:cyclopropane fatty-acyl-phospholipid synthase-like methyltransferase
MKREKKLMGSEALSQNYWEQVSHSELRQFATDEKTAGDVQALERILSPMDRILDLGCGWGRVTCALARRGYNVVGVDLSDNLLAYARQAAAGLGLNIQFKTGSMLKIPYPDETFNKIICLWGAFNHLLTRSEQVLSLDEMYRVLRPGGRSLIEMGNGESKRYRRILANEGYGPDNRIWNSQLKEGDPPNVLYIHDRKTLAGIAADSRFQRFQVKFQNINHKRRTILCLSKQPQT